MQLVRFGVVICLCVSASTTIAGSEEDIARAETEYELRRTAQGLFDQAHERATEAVTKSSAGEALRKQIKTAFDECMAEADALTEASEDRKWSLEERYALVTESQRVLLSCPDRISELSTANDGLIGKLRDDFIAEEIDQLRAVMDEVDLRLLKSAVRDILDAEAEANKRDSVQ